MWRRRRKREAEIHNLLNHLVDEQYVMRKRIPQCARCAPYYHGNIREMNESESESQTSKAPDIPKFGRREYLWSLGQKRAALNTAFRQLQAAIS